MPTLSEAADGTRTGDVWLFRGRSSADRAIRTFTNAPVNHVGMALVIEDLPPLMWHAELGQSLPDVWTGRHQRGVQLHDLVAAVTTWSERYGQQAWLRQLNGTVTPAMEDAALQTVARLDGTAFPSTVQLAGGWAKARLVRREHVHRRSGGTHRATAAETAFCADVLARTYQAMGLLGRDRPAAFYDPGSFWSGDGLTLTPGFSLGAEIEVRPNSTPGSTWGLMCIVGVKTSVRVMTSTDWIIDIALVLLVLRQMREARLDRKFFLIPLGIVGYTASHYLTSFPTGGNDLMLLGACLAAGMTFGAVGGLITHVRGADGMSFARAGYAAAGLWVANMGARLGFIIWITHSSGQASLTRFSIDHHITGGDVWQTALVLLALSEVLVRVGVIGFRGHRRAAASRAGATAGVRADRLLVAA